MTTAKTNIIIVMCHDLGDDDHDLGDPVDDDHDHHQGLLELQQGASQRS